MPRNVYETTEQFNDAAMTENRSNASGRFFDMQKKRVAAIVQNNDALGTYRWNAWDGANYQVAGTISCTVDGVPSVGNVAGRISISPGFPGSGPIEATRWTNLGYMLHAFSAYSWTMPTVTTAVNPASAIGGATLIGQRASGAAIPAVLHFQKQNTAATVANGDEIGSVEFHAFNGSSNARGARVYTVVQGTVSGTSMPMAFRIALAPTGNNTARDVVEFSASGDISTKAQGRYINDGSTTQDTRLLLYGGASSPTKAVSLNFTGAVDSQGAFMIQRRTSADAFEATHVAVGMTNGEVLIGTTTFIGNGYKLTVVAPMKATSGWFNGWLDSYAVTQGGFIGWNRTGGTGEQVFINSHPSGTGGGWHFVDLNTTTVTFTNVFRVLANGETLGKTYGAALVNKGTITTAVAFDFTAGNFQQFTETSAQNPTISITTAPSNPCPFWLKIIAPAAGTSPTITYPATFKGAWPTTVTLAKYSLVEGFFDGTNYNYIGGTLNV